jgi:hypothetical protein
MLPGADTINKLLSRFSVLGGLTECPDSCYHSRIAYEVENRESSSVA